MTYDMQFGERITEEFQRAKLKELLDQCTPEQCDVFLRMYPRGVSRAGLCWALTQCNNSLSKNQENQ